MLLTPKVHNVDELRESGDRERERERGREFRSRASQKVGEIIDVSFVRGVGHEELQPSRSSMHEPEPDGPDGDVDDDGTLFIADRYNNKVFAAGSIRGRAG